VDRVTANELDRLARARQAVQGIGDAALRSNQHRAEVLAVALEAAGRGDLNDDDWSAAAAVAHQLVGSAGTFGYTRASKLARELEHFLIAAESGPSELAAARAALGVISLDLRAAPDDEQF